MSQSAVERINPSIKKCWICFSLLDLKSDELERIQRIFSEMSLNSRASYKKNSENFIKMKIFLDKIVLSVCKCKKKLAHKNCFDNHIDLSQNWNVEIAATCSQCNYKYDFEYPYNGMHLYSELVILRVNDNQKF